MSTNVMTTRGISNPFPELFQKVLDTDGYVTYGYPYTGTPRLPCTASPFFFCCTQGDTNATSSRLQNCIYQGDGERMWRHVLLLCPRMSVAHIVPRVAYSGKSLAKTNRVSVHTCVQLSLTYPTPPSFLIPTYPRIRTATPPETARFQPLLSVRSSLTSTSQASPAASTADGLPSNLQKIVEGFQSVSDPRARYQQLLFYASKLRPLAAEHHTTENKVVGCVSQVWVLPSIDSEGRVHFQADSDSALTKGLAALLVEGLSGAYPSEILKISPEFVQLLGLKQSLTPSRNNGFLNMLKLMQKKTLALYMQSEGQTASGSGADVASAAAPAASGSGDVAEVTGQTTGGGNGAAPSGGGGGGGGEGTSSGRPIYDGIKSKVEAALEGAEVDVDDVSHQHAGHAGVAKGSSETHFNVKIISTSFEGLTTVKRHRLVYNLLKDEFAKGLHALSLVTKTPSEVEGV